MKYKSGDEVRIACSSNPAHVIVATIVKVMGNDRYLVNVGDGIISVMESSILPKVHNFVRDDLRPGMVVEFRNGNFYIAMPDSDGVLFLISENGYYSNVEEYFDSNLKYKPKVPTVIREQFDVVKVYSCINKQDRYSMSLNIGKQDRDLLWERKKPKKMTTLEAKSLLKELTGDEVEIVERVSSDRIVVGENVFTDINKAIDYLKRLSYLKQFESK